MEGRTATAELGWVREYRKGDEGLSPRRFCINIRGFLIFHRKSKGRILDEFELDSRNIFGAANKFQKAHNHSKSQKYIWCILMQGLEKHFPSVVFMI